MRASPLVVGGTSGDRLETARLALAAGEAVTIAGRSAERLRWRADPGAGAGPRSDRIIAVAPGLIDTAALFLTSNAVVTGTVLSIDGGGSPV